MISKENLISFYQRVLHVQITHIVEGKPYPEEHIMTGICFIIDDLAVEYTKDEAIHNYLSLHFKGLKPSRFRYPEFWHGRNPHARQGGWWFNPTKAGNIERVKFIKQIIKDLKEIK